MTSSTPEAIATRRAPNRSASIPAGIETATVASAGSESTNADADALRPNSLAIRGSRGTIAVWLRPETKNSASTMSATAAVPLDRRRARAGIREVDGIGSGGDDLTIGGVDGVGQTRYDRKRRVLHDGFEQLRSTKWIKARLT